MAVVTAPHLDPTWLRQKYEVEGLSTYDIGRLVGRDPKRIYQKLRDFGIPTRPRGHNVRSGDDRPWEASGWTTGSTHTAESRAKISVGASRPRPWLRGEANGMFGVVQADNPNWRGGISPERQRIYASSAWKAVRREVIIRDGGVCLRCGAIPSGARSLHLHHVDSWADAPNRRLDPTNLVSMCRKCHEWTHSDANTSAEWLSHPTPSLSSSETT
jgi:hypothetical protein